jgi:hypothetical protein
MRATRQRLCRAKLKLPRAFNVSAKARSGSQSSSANLLPAGPDQFWIDRGLAKVYPLLVDPLCSLKSPAGRQQDHTGFVACGRCKKRDPRRDQFRRQFRPVTSQHPCRGNGRDCVDVDAVALVFRSDCDHQTKLGHLAHRVSDMPGTQSDTRRARPEVVRTMRPWRCAVVGSMELLIGSGDKAHARQD